MYFTDRELASTKLKYLCVMLGKRKVSAEWFNALGLIAGICKITIFCGRAKKVMSILEIQSGDAKITTIMAIIA